MLFLGAGASSSFGIGDLTDWTEKADGDGNKNKAEDESQAALADCERGTLRIPTTTTYQFVR
jgi:hypothetical protein